MPQRMCIVHAAHYTYKYMQCAICTCVCVCVCVYLAGALEILRVFRVQNDLLKNPYQLASLPCYCPRVNIIYYHLNISHAPTAYLVVLDNRAPPTSWGFVPPHAIHLAAFVNSPAGLSHGAIIPVIGRDGPAPT